jgi:hypothetical protein
LPLQTSFFEDYLGEGEETCGSDDSLEDPYETDVTEKCNNEQLTVLDKKFETPLSLI